MIALSGVLDAINARGIRLYRTSDNSLQLEGDCPPELVEGIAEHRESLLRFAAASEEVKAAEASDNIRRQVEDYAVDTVRRYLPRHADERLARAVDTQDPAGVRREIERLKQQADTVDWACTLFPATMEIEAKHAAEAGGSHRNLTTLLHSEPAFIIGKHMRQ